MEKDNLDYLFENLKDSFDTEEPKEGHTLRFLEKLETAQNVVHLQKKSNLWWKPLSLVASLALLAMVGIGLFKPSPTIDQQVAKISPEVSKTEFYFASLVQEQVKQLQAESTPETQKIISDTMVQLKKLEADYTVLEKNLLNGGNSKLLLSAMITNFQTRIDLLQDVLNQVETIKNIKNYNDANYTI